MQIRDIKVESCRLCQSPELFDTEEESECALTAAVIGYQQLC